MIDILCARPHRLWKPMVMDIARAYSAGEQVVLLVPEQYTLQAERDLLRDLQLPGFFRLEILSPSRVEYRVFEEFNAGIKIHIDEQGKMIALTRVLQKTAKGLTFYTNSEDRPGFIKRMSVLLATLKELNINAEDLLQAADRAKDDKPLWSKLRDTALILCAYEEMLAGRFADREDVSSEMLVRLEKGHLFSGKQVFVFGFDLLTVSLIDLMIAAAGQADKLSIRMVSDMSQAPDGDLFQPVQGSILRLMDKFKKHHLDYHFRWLPPSQLDASNDLAHMERCLFNPRGIQFTAPPESLRVYAAPTPYQEVQQLAQQIVLQIRSGTSTDDIMIICGNLPLYRSLISSTFDSFGIPYYLADKMPLTAHPVIRAMLSALRCAADGYPTQEVLDYIKSGFSPLTEAEGFILQNYSSSYGIKKQKWLSPFTHGEENERQICEALRIMLTGPIETLHQSLVGSETCENSFACLSNFFIQSGVYKKAEFLNAELEKNQLSKQAAQLNQVFDKLREVFAQMSALMDEERIPLKHFPLWLENGMSQQEIGSIPQSSGNIQVGQIGNLIPHRPKVLFVLGLNDGILSSSDDQLLTAEETQEAEHVFKSHFGIDTEGREKMASLDLLKALSAPRERLYLSYALANEEGGAMYPLRELKALKNIFPLLVEEGGALAGRAEDAACLPISPNPALETLALKLQRGTLSGLWLDAWALLGQDEQYQANALDLLKSMRGEMPQSSIGTTAAQSVFDIKKSSVSRLESFASCPFRHFVDFGLKPQPLEEWTVEPVDTGRFYHDAMDKFTKIAINNADWPHIQRQDAEQLMDAAIEPLMSVWKDLPFYDTARLRKVSEGYVKVARRMAWVVTEGASQSSFRPVQTELRFGEGGILPPLLLTLPGGGVIELHGIIDRLDQYTDEEGNYLRVIDYKSGTTSLSPEKLYMGIQMQLMIYLQAVLAAWPQAIPAGAFYQRLTDPMIDGEDPQEAGREADKRLQLRGIALNDARVVKLMNGPDEKVLGILFNKDGTPKKNKSILSEDEIGLLSRHSKEKAIELADQIAAGIIERLPAVYADKRRACEFCPHQGICRIDWHQNAACRLIPRMNMEDLLIAISPPAGKEK